jgi:AcrR family transcriptional regulator
MPADPLGADDYVRAALDVLAHSGSEGLTIAALCRRLAVTKGSFYHHFDGMPAFTTALLHYWETEHSDRLIATSKAVPDPVERIGVLTDIAVDLPHAAESAIRAWARSNPEVSKAQARVDAHREKHLTDAFRAVGLARADAVLQARLALAVMIGMQARGPFRGTELRAMYAHLNEALADQLSPADSLRLRALLA